MKPGTRKLSLLEIIRLQVDNDPQTIQDRAVMRAKWGIEYVPKKKFRKVLPSN